MISIHDEKIKKYLDELAIEYKELLYDYLISQTNNLDELNISELLRIDSEIKKPLFKSYRKFYKKSRLLLAIGLTYMFIGFLVFILLIFLKYEMEPLYIIQFILLAMGIFISIFSFIYSSVSYNKKREKEDIKLLEFKIVTKWRELEEIVNEIDDTKENKTSTSIIGYLFNKNFIDKSNYITMKNFLRMRNEIVHNPNHNYSAMEMKNMLNDVDNIISNKII